MGAPSGASGASAAGNGGSKRAGAVTDARGRLEPGEVARMFEERLAEALLGESAFSVVAPSLTACLDTCLVTTHAV